MRNVKCRLCKTSIPIDQAYKVEHITSGGIKQNQYYCSQEEYEKDKNEKVCRNKFELKMDELFGYPVINNYKRTIYNTILKGGYTNEEMYNCLLEKFNDIESSLGYRSDIENETQRIQYIYAIIKNSIWDITRRDKISEKKMEISSMQIDDYAEYQEPKTNIQINKRKTLAEMLGGK